MDYDRTNIPEVYKQARHHGPAFLEQWMQVIAGQVGTAGIRDILDLGCGTGRFSSALAAHFKADLVGIDPSMKMLHEASKNRSNGAVYVSGRAEAIPLSTDSIDMIFISMVFHHFKDPRTVAEECCRVLRRDGRLCLRTASSEQISVYPYVPFFPSSRKLLEERLPSIEFQREIFESASFEMMSYDVVVQEVAPNHSAYADKLALKADSIIASLSDEDFENGLRDLRAHASAMPSRPVTEPIDFIVFGKRS